MRVLFLKPKIARKCARPTEPPLSLAVLAAVAEEAGHEVACLDMELSTGKELREAVQVYLPEVVGISFTSPAARAARALAATVRRLGRDAVIVGGGHGMTCSPVAAMSESEFDYGVVGEGELTLLQLLGHLEVDKPMESVAGVAWKRGEEIVVNEPRQPAPDLDRFPFLAFHHFDLKAYGHVLPVFFTRGRQMQNPCSETPAASEHKPRTKSPERFVAELKHYVRAFGIRTFSFTDDSFAADRANAEELCDLLIKEDLGIRWHLGRGIRADTVDEPLLKKMRRAGCRIVAMGVATVNPQSLRILGRDVSVDQTTRAIMAAKRAGMIVKTFNLIGCPGDTFDDVMKTIRYNIDLGVDIPRCGVPYPFPGSHILEWVKKNGRMNGRLGPEDCFSGAIRSVRDVPYETDTMSFRDIYRATRIFRLEADRQVIRSFLRRYLGRAGRIFHPIVLRAPVVRMTEILYNRFLRGKLEIWQ